MIARLGTAAGHLWRAVGPDDVVVLIRLSPTASHRVSDDASQSLQILDVPNVARVLDQFQVGESITATVSEWIPGSPIDAWIADHGESQPGLRLSLLRQIAVALDVLHGGNDTREPSQHGALSPAIVLVQADLRVVLTGLGADVAERSNDAHAFAILVAQVLSGSFAGAAADAVRCFEESTAGLARPELVRRVAEVLEARPEATPRRLREWLDSAGDEPDETSASSKLLPIDEKNSVVPDHGRSIRRPLALVAAACAITVSIALVATHAFGPGSSGQRSPKQAFPSAPPLTLASWTWPLAAGCDPTTAVAYVDAGTPRPSGFGLADIRTAVADSRSGGAWYQGHLRLRFLAGARPVLITQLRPTAVGEQIVPPVWIFRPPSMRCTAPAVSADHQYTYDIRRGSLAFTPVFVAADASAVIDLDIRDCGSNAAFTFDVRYALAGQASMQLDVSGLRIQIFGYASGTSVYTQSKPGGPDVHLSAMTGSEGSCG